MVNFLEGLDLLDLFGSVVPICNIEHDVKTVFHFCLLLTAS